MDNAEDETLWIPNCCDSGRGILYTSVALQLSFTAKDTGVNLKEKFIISQDLTVTVPAC